VVVVVIVVDMQKRTGKVIEYQHRETVNRSTIAWSLCTQLER